MTRTIRRVSQVVFLGLFLFLVLKTAYPLWNRIPSDLLLRLDPLIAGTAMLAARKIIPGMAISLIIVGMTLVLGRIFCGWICPLGTTLDLADRLFYRKRRTRSATKSLGMELDSIPRQAQRDGVQLHPQRLGRGLHSLKYYILAGLAVTALFSMQYVYLLDPISLLHRTVVIGFIAPVQMALRWASNHVYSLSQSSFGPLASSGMWLSDRMAGSDFITNEQMYFGQAFLVLAVFAGIIGLNSISRRYWCRNLCPLGALLGLMAHIPVLKRAVSPKCNDCGRCVHDCKMASILENPRQTRVMECIECFDCVEVCPQDAICFRMRPRPVLDREIRLDLSRRRVLQGMGVGLGLVTVAKIDPGRKLPTVAGSSVKLGSEYLIRPPGSVPESEFVAKCTRCGLCMKACPTNGVQPAMFEAGIEGIWTPILVPKIGACTQECNACGEVCPTDAIEPFKIKDKKDIFIGTAVVHRDRCIAWNAGKQCIVCDEYCSYKAIVWKVVDGWKVPFVDEEKCVGCGLCECACPIQPVAAIRVHSFGDRRGNV